MLNHRFEMIKLRVDSFKEKMNIKGINVVLKDTFNSWAARPGLVNDVIMLPPCDLFQGEDIPLAFRITDFDDPRLENLDFLNQVAGWMNTQFKEAGLSAVVCETDYVELQQFLLLRRDPDLNKENIDFTICHELAHCQNLPYLKFLFCLLLIICIAALIMVVLNFLGISIILFGIALLTCTQMVHLACLSQGKLEEKRADLVAVQFLKDARGGIYFFETVRNLNMKLREHHPKLNEIFDEDGNDLKSKDHPPLNVRVAYLQEWQYALHTQSAVVDPLLTCATF
jgi:hypothetical protein